MRRINFKVIFWLTLFLVLVAIFGFGLWDFNARRTASQFLQQAEAEEVAGDLPKALSLYKKYLRYNQSDQEVLSKTALLAHSLAPDNAINEDTFRQIQQTGRLLSQAMRLNPDSEALRRARITNYIKEGAHGEAARQIQKLGDRDIIDPKLDLLQAQCYTEMGDDEKALEIFSELVGYDPTRDVVETEFASGPNLLEAFTSFAALLRQRGTRGRQDELLADRLIEVMLDLNKDNAEAWLLRGKYLSQFFTPGDAAAQNKRIGLVKESLRTALEMDAENVEILGANAQLATKEDDFKSAEDFLLRAEKISPEDPRIYISLAQLSLLQNKFDAARSHVERGLLIFPEYIELQLELINIALLQKDLDQINGLIRQLEDWHAPTEIIAIAEAKVLIAQKEWDSAITILEKARPLAARLPALLNEIDSNLLKCFTETTQNERVLETCARLIAANPSSIPALYGRATALYALGRLPDAYNAFMQLRRSVGDGLFFGNTEYRDAYITVLQKLEGKGAQYKTAYIEARTKVFGVEGVLSFENPFSNPGGRIDPATLSQMIEEVKANLTKDPNDSYAQDIFLNLLARKEGTKTALAFLENALKSDANRWEDRPGLLNLRARWYLYGNKEAQSEKSEEQLARLENFKKAIEAFPTEDQYRAWIDLCQLYGNLQPPKMSLAAICLEQARNIDPKNRLSYDLALFLARHQNSAVEMNRVIADARQAIGKDSDLVACFEAVQALWEYDQDPNLVESLSVAAAAIDRLSAIRPKWHRLHKLKGKLALREKRNSDAIEHFQSALKLGPLDMDTVTLLANLLVTEKRFQEARKLFALFDEVPEGISQFYILANAIDGDPKIAKKALDEEMDTDSATLKELQFYGMMLDLMNFDQDAETVLRKAAILEPDAIDNRLQLINLLLDQEKSDEALREVRLLENGLSASVDDFDLLGDVYARSNNPLLTDHYLHKSVESNPNNLAAQKKLIDFLEGLGRNDEAVNHLNSILESKKESSDKDAPIYEWARRNLAFILARLGNHENLLTALGLIEANRIDGELSWEDEQLRGFLLANRDEPLYKQTGLEILQSVPIDRHRRRERMLMARLFSENNQWVECRQLMEWWIISNPTDVPALLMYIDMLLAHNETSLAGLWLRKLNTLPLTDSASTRFAPVIKRLEMLLAKQRGNKNLGNSLVGQARGLENGAQIALVARLLEELELFDEASEQYRRAAKAEQRLQPQFAAYLARRGNVDETIAICNEMISTAATESAREEILGFVCGLTNVLTMNASTEMNDSQIKQLKDWFVEMKTIRPNDFKIQMNEALLLFGLEQLDDAVALITQIPDDDLSEANQILLINNRAMINLLSGNEGPDPVIQSISRAIKEYGPKSDLLDTRALAYLKKEECDKAIQDLLQATLFESQQGLYHLHLAWAHHCHDDRDSARIAMETAEKNGLKMGKLGDQDSAMYESLQQWLNN